MPIDNQTQYSTLQLIAMIFEAFDFISEPFVLWEVENQNFLHGIKVIYKEHIINICLNTEK